MRKKSPCHPYMYLLSAIFGKAKVQLYKAEVAKLEFKESPEYIELKSMIKKEKYKCHKQWLLEKDIHGQFKKKILLRDNLICQMCGNSQNLQIHHIKPVSLYKEYIMKSSNCISLCKTCHNWVHKKQKWPVTKSKQSLKIRGILNQVCYN